MIKYNIILETAKEMHNLAITRRNQIRDRVNIVAAFGFTVISFLVLSVVDRIDILQGNLSRCVLCLLPYFLDCINYSISWPLVLKL